MKHVKQLMDGWPPVPEKKEAPKKKGGWSSSWRSGETAWATGPSVPYHHTVGDFPLYVDSFRNRLAAGGRYFLTHFHSDHYGGLCAAWKHSKIICGEATAKLVEKELKVSREYLEPIPFNEPYHMVLGTPCKCGTPGCRGRPFTVTLIDAHHCPGAAQMIFEFPPHAGQPARRYLHSGDIRYTKEWKDCPRLRRCTGGQLDVLYLDTTYCDEKHSFAPQSRVIEEVAQLAHEEVQSAKGKGMSVGFVVGTYTIGKEKIFLGIARATNTKIHVTARKWGIISCLGWDSETLGLFTKEPKQATIRVVATGEIGRGFPTVPDWKKLESFRVKYGFGRLVAILPTGWNHKEKGEKSGALCRRVEPPPEQRGRLSCLMAEYSEHSSYREMCEYVAFLNPKKVIPTVNTSEPKMRSQLALIRHTAGDLGWNPDHAATVPTMVVPSTASGGMSASTLPDGRVVVTLGGGPRKPIVIKGLPGSTGEPDPSPGALRVLDEGEAEGDGGGGAGRGGGTNPPVVAVTASNPGGRVGGGEAMVPPQRGLKRLASVDTTAMPPPKRKAVAQQPAPISRTPLAPLALFANSKHLPPPPPKQTTLLDFFRPRKSS